MKYKITGLFCLSLLLFCLAGCQLAREDLALDTMNDRLAGIFLTTEPLALFDSESQLNDKAGGLDKHQDRLYADLVADTTDQEVKTKKYVFPDLVGLEFFTVTVPAEDEFDSYKTSQVDPALSGVHIAYDHKDEGERITMEGRLHLTPDFGGTILYINPVYQSGDSQVYIQAGQGIMVSKADYTEGEFMSQTLADIWTVEDNDGSREDSTAVKLAFHTMFQPEEIILLQMAEDSGILHRQSYNPGQLPDQLPLEKTTAYLIAETRKKDGTGNPLVSREMVSPADEYLTTWFSEPDGLCLGQLTWLEWPEN